MDVLAVKQACKFAKEHALKNGPLVSYLFSCSYLSKKFYSAVLVLFLLNWGFETIVDRSWICPLYCQCPIKPLNIVTWDWLHEILPSYHYIWLSYAVILNTLIKECDIYLVNPLDSVRIYNMIEFSVRVCMLLDKLSDWCPLSEGFQWVLLNYLMGTIN